MRYQRDGFSVEAARKKKRKLPDWYLDQPPEPPRGAEFFYEAYRDLTTCRVDAGPIPWTAARLYAGDKGLPPDLAAAMWTVIRKMDLAERQWRQTQPEVAGG